MMLRMFFPLWLLLLLPLLVQADIVSEAKAPVDRLNHALLDVMRGGSQLGYNGRYKKLDPIVRETFEFEAVSLIALGSHWKKLDDTQKQEFKVKLTDLSVATYAAQFKTFAGEDFVFDSSQDLKNGRLLLRYNLVAPKEKPIRFEYLVGQFNGSWRIINIVVDGISDLALKKAQYTSVMDREGFDALLAKLTQKISDYARNNAV